MKYPNPKSKKMKWIFLLQRFRIGMNFLLKIISKIVHLCTSLKLSFRHRRDFSCIKMSRKSCRNKSQSGCQFDLSLTINAHQPSIKDSHPILTTNKTGGASLVFNINQPCGPRQTEFVGCFQLRIYSWKVLSYF